MADAPELLLVGEDDGELVGSVLAGYDVTRGLYQAIGYRQDRVVSYGKRLVSDD